MCTRIFPALAMGFVLALDGFLPAPAQAQTAAPAVLDIATKPIGKVVAATGSVIIEHATATVVQATISGQVDQTKVGDLVYLGDVVRTGADGRVGINFTDGSAFNLSSNAHMTLDEFVYDPNGKSNATLFNLTKGTFTFVAGKVAKTGDMKIDTPVATMGVRGTTPRIEMADDGTVRFSTLIEEGKSKLARKPTGRQPEQRANYKNIGLCNGSGPTSLATRITGCSALIDSGEGTTNALAIAYNNRGNAYAAQGDNDRAIEDFDRSIRLDGSNAKPFNNRGVAYLRKGEYDLAIADLDQAIGLNRSYGGAFANRAQARLKTAEYDRAAKDYDEAIRLQPNLEAALNGRCWTRAILGSLQAALEDCNKALQSGPTDAATYDSRGLIYLKMGQHGAAIDDYSSALRSDPKLASALYGRGLAKLKNGDVAGSDADISAAKTIQAGIADDFTRYGVR